MAEVTQILSQIEQGDPSAAAQLLPLVYSELRKLAATKLAQERPGQTLQATALVHEAYLRLVDVEKVQSWESRGHFFSAAAESIRRILVDRARRKRSEKRGGGRAHFTINEELISLPTPHDDLIRLDDALRRLEEVDQKTAQLIKLRYFSGLTISQSAQALGISTRTANRLWTYGKAWLRTEIQSA